MRARFRGQVSALPDGRTSLVGGFSHPLWSLVAGLVPLAFTHEVWTVGVAVGSIFLALMLALMGFGVYSHDRETIAALLRRAFADAPSL